MTLQELKAKEAHLKDCIRKLEFELDESFQELYHTQEAIVREISKRKEEEL